MIFRNKKSIKIQEVKKSSVQISKQHMRYLGSSKTLEFSSYRLYVATARSILSRDLSNLDLLYEVVSCYFRFKPIINKSHDNLRLNEKNITNLRDFSKSTRVGEIAQGVTYLFSQDILKQPIIVDFDGFIKNKKPKATYKGQTPDYIIQKDPNFEVSLIESKGHFVTSTNKSTKEKLKNALKQCTNGETIITSILSSYSVKNTYGTCLKLFNEKVPKDIESLLEYVDPEEKINNKEFNLELVQYHYASMFLLFGNLKIYKKLLNGELLIEQDLEEFKEERIIGFKFFTMSIFPYFESIIEPQFLLLFLWGEYEFGYHFGIREEIMKLLMGEEISLSNIKLSLNEEHQKEYSNSQYEYFNDGTLIFDSKNNKT